MTNIILESGDTVMVGTNDLPAITHNAGWHTYDVITKRKPRTPVRGYQHGIFFAPNDMAAAAYALETGGILVSLERRTA